MKFYRLGCGCVVLLSEDGKTARDIERCDSGQYDNDTLDISDWKEVEERHVTDGAPLSTEQEELLIDRLRNLVRDGYRHRQIARALGIMKDSR